MAQTGRIIRFSYDVISPWSYLAYIVLKRYRTIWNFKLELDPASLGGVINVTNNTPPFKTPNKQKKYVEEVPMMAKFFGVKCTPPEKFPFNTLPMMRFLKVVKDQDPSQLEVITDKFFDAIFVDAMSVENLDAIFDTLTPYPYSREKVREFRDVSQSNPLKQVLRDDSLRLAEDGAFGFPWIHVFEPNGKELTIFGSDRFEFLANWLGEEWKGPNPGFQHQKSHL